MSARAIGAVALILVLAPQSLADQLVVTTDTDNTLIQDPNGAYSAGAAYYFFAGRVGTNGEGSIRRGCIHFDVSAIPPNAIVESVTVKLHCSAAGSSATYPISLKRLTAAFGEGTSFAFGGGGAASTPGDATWLHSFYPDVFWNTPGGDFVSAASATKNVAGQGSYTWSSTAGLVADVQEWVASPEQNFGWLVQGNEVSLHSVKRFDSHESGGSVQPVLTVVYSVPEPVVGDLDGDGIVGGADLAQLLGAWGESGPGLPADLNESGTVDGGDLAMLLGAWTSA